MLSGTDLEEFKRNIALINWCKKHDSIHWGLFACNRVTVDYTGVEPIMLIRIEMSFHQTLVNLSELTIRVNLLNCDLREYVAFEAKLIASIVDHIVKDCVTAAPANSFHLNMLNGSIE